MVPTIAWTVGGIDLSVFGEMQGPPSFTHEHHLIRFAGGLRLPRGVSGDAVG